MAIVGKLFTLLKHKFVRDTAFLQAGTFVTAGTYVLTSMLLARSLGPGDLGRYDLAFKFYTLCFFVANLGLVNVLVVHYSQAAGKGDLPGKIEAQAAFVKVYLLIACTIVLLGFLLCPWLGETHYHDRQLGYYGWALCLIGFFDILRALVVATLMGTREMKEVAYFESAVAVLRIVVLVFAVVGGYQLAGIIYGSVLHALLASIMGFRFYFRMRRNTGDQRPPRLWAVLKAVPRAPLRQFFSLGIFIALNKNINEIIMIVGAFLMVEVSFQDNGHLRIATVLIWGLQLLLGGVTRNLLPTLGFKLGKKGKQDIAVMGRTLFKVALISGLAFITLTAVFLLAMPLIVKILYGSEYRECIWMVQVLALSHLVLGFGVIIEPFYIYANRIKTSVVINTILFALILPFGYWAQVNYQEVGVVWYLAMARSLMAVHLIYILLYFLRLKWQKKRLPEGGKA